jgi:hypothetical protein
MLTEEILKIFWKGDETPGLSMYAVWDSDISRPVEFPISVWPPGTAVNIMRLSGPGWHVVGWQIKVAAWPANGTWLETLKATLSVLIANGALVGWCGVEGFFEDPPHLFSDAMGEGVYAGLTPHGKFFCSAEMGKPFGMLKQAEILELRRAATIAGLS